MRSWILGFLLAVMAVQSTWASFAVYCQHRADVLTEHIGHHEHQHRAVAPDADATPEPAPLASDTPSGSQDSDCGYCHLGCAQPLAVVSDPWFGQAAHAFVAQVQSRYATREPEGLERPQWQRLARPASREELLT